MRGSSSPLCRRKRLILETARCVCVAWETGRGLWNSSSPVFDTATWSSVVDSTRRSVPPSRSQTPLGWCALMSCNRGVFCCVWLRLSGEFQKVCVTQSEHLHRDLSLQGGCCSTGGTASGKESFLFIEFQQLFLSEGCRVPLFLRHF